MPILHHSQRAPSSCYIHKALPTIPPWEKIYCTNRPWLPYLAPEFQTAEGQLAHWIEQLQEYDFEVNHRRGVSHGKADALSRRSCPQCGRDSHNDTLDPVITAPPADV